MLMMGCHKRNLPQAMRNTTQFCEVMRQQYGISTVVPLTSFRKETSGGATYKISAVFSGNYPTLRATDKPYDNTKPPTNYVRYLVRKQTFSLYSFKKFPQVTVWPL